MSGARALALAASALLAVAILVLPWYRLGAYEPSGWEATLWLRIACVLAVAGLVALRLGVRPAIPAVLALALVALRVAFPPDFGFGFDGLEVDVERRWGAWVGLGAAVLAAAAGSRAGRVGQRT